MQKYLFIFEKYFFWILILLVVFIPLYPKFPLLNIPKTYVAIRGEDIIIALAGLIWIFGYGRKIKKIFDQTIYQAFFLFWIIGGLSLMSALLITYFIEPHLGFLHWLRRVEYMSLFVMAATSINSIKQVKIFLKIFLITAVIVVIYGFGQIWLDFPVISTTNKEFSKGLILFLTSGARVNSTFAGHYDLAVYLSLVLVIVASLFFYYQPIFHKILLILVGSISFILLGLTAARVSFIATFFGIASVFWLGKKKLLVLLLAFAAIGLIAIIPDLRHRLVATITVNFMGGGGIKYTPAPGAVNIFTPKAAMPTGIERGKIATTSTFSPSGVIAIDTAPGEPINTTELGVYRSWGIRFNVEWPRALAAFYKNPFLGTGYSSLAIATDSDYLRSLGEVGLLGTLSLILIFFIIIKRMLRFLENSEGFEKYYILGTVAAIFVLLGSALVIDVMEASKVAEIFWLLLGIGWAVMDIYKREHQKE